MQPGRQRFCYPGLVVRTSVVEAAEDRETLRQWLDQADLMNPVPILESILLAS